MCTGVRSWSGEDRDEQIHLWPDRCPHRGMRLSLGFLRDGQLACAYHGWRFDGSGRCRFIPAHPEIDVPPSMAVDPLVTVEAASMVWLSTHSSVSQLPPTDDTIPIRSLSLSAPHALVAAALAATGAEVSGPTPRFRFGSGVLFAAVQVLDEARTAVHLSATAAALEVVTPAEISRWAADLRDEVELRALRNASDHGSGEYRPAGDTAPAEAVEATA